MALLRPELINAVSHLLYLSVVSVNFLVGCRSAFQNQMHDGHVPQVVYVSSKGKESTGTICTIGSIM